MDVSNLSPEEKARLLNDLLKEKEAEETQKRADREAFKKLKNEAVTNAFSILSGLSEQMIETKKQIFDMFADIIDLKNDLFNSKMDRKSDSLTTEDGSITLKLGNRTSEGWDDTVEMGVAKVREYLKTLAKDENSADLVETVMSLLSKDRKGNLKANKVLELKKLAIKSGNEDFLEGLRIIEDAYRPSLSCQFIEVRYKDENGKEKALPLSMSAIEY